MAIVVESTSTNTASSATSLTITKPTGLAVGNLMVAPLSIHNSGDSETDTWNTLSGWTAAVGGNFNSFISLSLQYKIADAGDVAASNFTFTASGTAGRLAGSILRCSGNAPSSVLGASDSESNTSSGTSFSGSLSSYTPPGNGALVIIQIGSYSSGNPGFPTVSGYDTTTSGISFTELYDNGSASSNTGVTSAAYGIQTTAAALTAYSATVSHTHAQRYGQFAVFIPSFSGNGSNALLEVSPTFFDSAISLSNGASNALLEVSPTLNNGSADSIIPTVWTPITKT